VELVRTALSIFERTASISICSLAACIRIVALSTIRT
jgi:hypothetical protein